MDFRFSVYFSHAHSHSPSFSTPSLPPSRHLRDAMHTTGSGVPTLPPSQVAIVVVRFDQGVDGDGERRKLKRVRDRSLITGRFGGWGLQTGKNANPKLPQPPNPSRTACNFVCPPPPLHTHFKGVETFASHLCQCDQN